MTAACPTDLPPVPGGPFSFGKVTLRFVRTVPGLPALGLVPYYHFRITTQAGRDVGHINFRVGETEHVVKYAGHVGYEITENFRGHGYAFQACQALAPLVRSFYAVVIITSDPENQGSIRTIERLGAELVEEIEVPRHDPQYERGSRRKKRYAWRV